ncbi:Trehalose 6-phosphate phosphorylase [Chitinispirillum alkaliphilum]|nr:Trehalose 6-phosphate phosphorylase [Chitinispirillum alkaliphilum]
MFELKGAIFDLDGVVTNTAKTHSYAWKKIFDDYLQELSEKNGTEFVPFTLEDDYLVYVDGKPRLQGICSFLASRDIEMPLGSPGDGPEKTTAHGLATKKNNVFRNLISSNGADIFNSTIELVKELRKAGIKTGIASSSKNCRYILEVTGLIDLFETVVDGNVSLELKLKGKPHPDIFLQAAKNMGVDHNECMMVEDAISGVQSGKNGNFALVLGVARHGAKDKENLLQNGADIVVEDLSQITLKEIKEWFKSGIEQDSWKLSYYGFDPADENLRETLTTTANGYYGTRGCFPGTKEIRDIHYPGTYIAGVYNNIPTPMHGRPVYNNDFVNCPNWLLIEMKIGDGDFFNPMEEEIVYYHHELNIKKAIVKRSMIFKDFGNRETKLEISQFASMDNPHCGALKYKITPLNYSSSIVLRSSLDGTVINDGVPRYRSLKSKHLTTITNEIQNDTLYLHTKTTASGVSIYTRAKHDFEGDCELRKNTASEEEFIGQDFMFTAKEGKEYRLNKLITIYTSLDQDTEKPEQKSLESIAAMPDYEKLKTNHIKKWASLWDKGDIVVKNDRFSQKALRLHIYHLFSTASEHNKFIDAGMPARGLSGEAYRGHVFWDELYIFPFYNQHSPEVTRSLLMYRYRHLDQARQNAEKNGYRGAMYPWQTADTGHEETQEVHYNPVSDKWDPDLSRNQRHVSLAIAYNIWEYYYCTYDMDFLYKYGAEMMIEIARMWASMAKPDKKTGRYSITGVMGPDEFHEAYPGSDSPGLKDNAYTNILVSWLTHKTIEMTEHLPADVLKSLSKKIGFEMKESKEWEHLINKLNVSITSDGIIEQFEGYMNLKELDWDSYKEKYDDIHRMDRILKSENDSPDKYKVAKQADVLMLFYLLSPGQVCKILSLMGYTIDDEISFLEKNYEYYVNRTSHGSTLSHVVHSAVLKYCNAHKEDKWTWFQSALKSDINDTQGGTTREGIHTGVMGGTIDMVIKSFAGISRFKDHIEVSPRMPEIWDFISFKLLHKDHWLAFTISKNKIEVTQLKSNKVPLYIVVNGTSYELEGSDTLEIEYQESDRIFATDHSTAL